MRINVLKQYIISKFSNISIKIKKINNIIKLIIIVFVALILTIILLRPINTVSLDKRQNSGKANIDNIYEKKIIDFQLEHPCIKRNIFSSVQAR